MKLRLPAIIFCLWFWYISVKGTDYFRSYLLLVEGKLFIYETASVWMNINFWLFNMYSILLLLAVGIFVFNEKYGKITLNATIIMYPITIIVSVLIPLSYNPRWMELSISETLHYAGFRAEPAAFSLVFAGVGLWLINSKVLKNYILTRPSI